MTQAGTLQSQSKLKYDRQLVECPSILELEVMAGKSANGIRVENQWLAIQIGAITWKIPNWSTELYAKQD